MTSSNPTASDAVIPSLQPDEFLRGHRGVVAAFNGLHTRLQVVRTVATHARSLGYGQMNGYLDAIAALNGIDLERLVADHTCYPVLHAVGDRMRLEEVSGDRVRCVELVMARAPEHGWRLCPACVECDLATLRYSYWRRRHQMPGQWRCPEHGCILLLVDTDDVFTTPDRLLHRSRPVHEAESAKQLSALPCFARAIAILDRLMTGKHSLDGQRCREMFCQRVRNRGEDPSAPRWFANFSAEMDRSLSIQGLSTFLNKRRTLLRAGGPRLFAAAAFDPGLNLAHTTVAIVASMLFPSVDAAYDALNGCESVSDLEGATHVIDTAPPQTSARRAR